MRYLRTAPTRKLLLSIAGALAVAVASAAIAVAATGGGPIPPPTTLARGVHSALGAARSHPVQGVSADITFTDNLIDSTDLTGRTVDPLLQGASGRLWWSASGRIRLELQSGDGDAQIVVNQRTWWISDPAQNVVVEGTLPAEKPGSAGSPAASHGPASLGQIEGALAHLMQRFNVTGPTATDVAGRAAYRVSVSPKTSAGLLGSIELAWDAARGVPLQFEVYARGASTPVLGVQASSISYGPVPASVFAISPPAGAKVMKLGTPTGSTRDAGHHHPAVTGRRAVSAHLDFTLHAPASADGLPLSDTRLVELGGHPAAMLVYGTGLGSITALESRSSGASAAPTSLGGISLPSHTVDGSSATVLSTPLGTILRLTHGGIAYTVLGSVTASDAESAAGALAAGG